MKALDLLLFSVSFSMQILQKSDISFQLKTKIKDIFINPTSAIKEGFSVYSRADHPELKYTEIEGELSVSAPGEYEAQDIFFTGKKVKNSDNIIYNINADNISLGVIAFISNPADIDLEFFETTDVLLVHVNNGTDSLPPKEAHEMIEKMSPKIAIFYGFNGNLEEVKKSLPNAKPIEKNIKIEKSDLDRIENTEFYYFE